MKTKRGLTTDDLDKLDRAHKAMTELEEHIVARLRERHAPAPQSAMNDVLLAIEDLVSEPVS